MRGKPIPRLAMAIAEQLKSRKCYWLANITVCWLTSKSFIETEYTKNNLQPMIAI
jgi:hypothetical protein